MAEALSRAHYSDRIDAASAGVDPWPDLHPMARRLMAERGDPLAGHVPEHADAYRDTVFDLVVTIGDQALREHPAYPGSPRYIHWAISDPADADRTPDSEAVFRDALRQIERDLASLVADQLGSTLRRDA